MKLLFFPSKDATITNAYSDLTTTRALYANMGGSDVMDMFVLYNRYGDLEYEVSRILLKFDIDSIVKRVGGYPALLESEIFLNLYNTPHRFTIPREFELEFYRLTHDWEEGCGLDMEQYSDEGGVSWKAFQTVPKGRPRPTIFDWTEPGGDFDSTSKKQFYFHEGVEDCRINITDWFLQWARTESPYPNYGILIKFPEEAETSYQRNFYIKKFFARKSQFFYKRPSLEVLLRDVNYVNLNYERSHFVIGSSLNGDYVNNLYYFNYSPYGVLTDIPGYETNDKRLYVKIFDSNMNVLRDNIRPLRVSTGIYKYELSLRDSEIGTSTRIYDCWYFQETDEKSFYTGKILLAKNENSYSFAPNVVIPKLYIRNLKEKYSVKEKTMFHVLAHDQKWNPNIWVSYYKDGRKNSIQLKNTYYKIVRKIDEHVIVDYSCMDEGSGVEYTRLFYNGEYNYFYVDFSIFEPGFMYEIRFLSVLEDGSYYEHPETFKFRVDETQSFRF